MSERSNTYHNPRRFRGKWVLVALVVALVILTAMVTIIVTLSFLGPGSQDIPRIPLTGLILECRTLTPIIYDSLTVPGNHTVAFDCSGTPGKGDAIVPTSHGREIVPVRATPTFQLPKGYLELSFTILDCSYPYRIRLVSGRPVYFTVEGGNYCAVVNTENLGSNSLEGFTIIWSKVEKLVSCPTWNPLVC